MLRSLAKIGIVLFCLWHMAAVLIQALSLVNSPSSMMIRIGNYTPYVQPYLSMISHHQDWNLFAPDPLLLVTEMSFEKVTGSGTWIQLRKLDGSHLGFFRRAPELKIMSNMHEKAQDPLKEAYIQDLCRTERLDVGTPIVIRRRSTLIPGYSVPLSIGSWRAWNPQWTEWIDYFTSCKIAP